MDVNDISGSCISRLIVDNPLIAARFVVPGLVVGVGEGEDAEVHEEGDECGKLGASTQTAQKLHSDAGALELFLVLVHGFFEIDYNLANRKDMHPS